MTLRIIQQGICIIDGLDGAVQLRGWELEQGDASDYASHEAAQDAARLAIIERAMHILAQQVLLIAGPPDSPDAAAEALAADVIRNAKRVPPINPTDGS